MAKDNRFLEGEENKQVVVIGPGGARTTAQTGVRASDKNGMSEYDRLIAGMIPGREGFAGYSESEAFDPETYEGDSGGVDASSPNSSNSPLGGDYTKGYGIGAALYKFFPEKVLETFAKEWVKYGDAPIALATTRKTQAWKDEFKYLEREDGSLIMSELEAVSTKATYRETLGEVGITDTTDFENNFEEMITGEVSAQEFQARIDTVYNAVKNNIPQVEELFREKFNIATDEPTIFAALINPDIEDKLLKGELSTLTIAAEAKAAGFSSTFNKFDALRKAGLTQEGARNLYQSAGTYTNMSTQTGTNVDLSTLESAAIGDVEARKALNLLQAEQSSMSSGKAGAAKKGSKVTGLLQD